MPKFSIIIPVYNVASFLRECLDSVKAQTFTDWEAICVDDGSTDGSGNILEEYAVKDSRFKVFHKKNGGVSSARNFALERVQGEWLGFLDGDDVFNVKLLETVFKAIIKYPIADMVCFGHRRFEDGEQCEWGITNSEYSFCDYRKKLSEFALKAPFSTRFYRAREAVKFHFKSFLLGEDLLWKAMIVDHLDSYVEINDLLYGYRQRMGSAMNSSETLDKRLSSLFWRYEVWKLLISSSKTVDTSVIRHMELSLTELYSHYYFASSKEIRMQLWPHWLVVLKELGIKCRTTRRIKYSSRLVVSLKSKVLMFCLFYIPHWLKLHGCHRCRASAVRNGN